MALEARSSRRYSVGSSPRRNLLESLENRQLMAVTSAKFNFQPATSGVPSGYLADTGKAYSSQNGQTYGWNIDNSRPARDRNTAADAVHDTIIGFGVAGIASKWELAVPNGTYAVSMTAGDAQYWDSTYGFAIEGQQILSGKPDSNNRFIDGSGTVTVTDGRLTLTSSGGSYNNRIASLDVSLIDSTTAGGATLTPPSSPTWISSWSDSANSAYVKWNDTSKNESGFIIEKSLDKKGWTEAGRVGANVTSYTMTGLNAGTKYYVRVKAFNASGTSTPSPLEDATTVKGSTTPGKPAVVGGVRSSGVSATSVTIQWNDVSNESGYRVLRSTDKNNYAEVGSVGANITSYTDNTVKASTKYYYEITAYNAGGTSTSTNIAVTTSGSAVSAPSAPSWLSAAANGTSGANLQWGDVSNESGYIIEKSTNGGSWGEHARVGANTTSYAASGLSANTSYSFRIRAFNSGGTSNASVQQTIKTQQNSTPSTPSGGGSNGPSGNVSSLAGINANSGSAASAKSALNDVGIKYVRLAMKSDWSNNDAANGWYASQAKEYKAAGFKVLLVVMQDRPTSYSQAKTFYSNLANNAALRNAVDYWQIGNETNIGKFWSGTADQYVKTSLKPAYEAFHAVGETVVGTGPSWDANYCKQLVSLGYNSYVDYAAFHPYGNGAAECISRAVAAKAAFGNKPIMYTEWSVSGYENNSTQWAAENTKVAAALANLGSMNFYYCLYTDSSRVGAGGILNGNGSHNSKFYDAVKSWLH